MQRPKQLTPFHSAIIQHQKFSSIDGSVTLLAGSAATGGAFAVAINEMVRGHEPPPHIREREDEYFYVLDGEMTVYCGSDVFHLRPNELVFLPHGMPQAHRCITPTVRVLVQASSGNGSSVTADEFLRRMSDTLARLPKSSDPKAVRLELAQLASEYGIRPVPPDQVKVLLPQYRGEDTTTDRSFRRY